MRDRAHRANVFAHHAGNVARRMHGNGVKIADKTYRLWANRYAGATVDTRIPADLKENGFFFAHVKFSYILNQD